GQPGGRTQAPWVDLVEALESRCGRPAIGAAGRINELVVWQCGKGGAERNAPDFCRRSVLCPRATGREPSRQCGNERDPPPARGRDQVTPRGVLVVIARTQRPNTATMAEG